MVRDTVNSYYMFYFFLLTPPKRLKKSLESKNKFLVFVLNITERKSKKCLHLKIWKMCAETGNLVWINA